MMQMVVGKELWLSLLLMMLKVLLLLLVYLVVLRVSSTAIHICQFGELRSPIVQVREILILKGEKCNKHGLFLLLFLKLLIIW